jgi:hypothetical protein
LANGQSVTGGKGKVRKWMDILCPDLLVWYCDYVVEYCLYVMYEDDLFDVF